LHFLCADQTQKLDRHSSSNLLFPTLLNVTITDVSECDLILFSLCFFDELHEAIHRRTEARLYFPRILFFHLRLMAELPARPCLHLNLRSHFGYFCFHSLPPWNCLRPPPCRSSSMQLHKRIEIPLFSLPPLPPPPLFPIPEPAASYFPIARFPFNLLQRLSTLTTFVDNHIELARRKFPTLFPNHSPDALQMRAVF